jgi:hypothetical protein
MVLKEIDLILCFRKISVVGEEGGRQKHKKSLRLLWLFKCEKRVYGGQCRYSSDQISYISYKECCLFFF